MGLREKVLEQFGRGGSYGEIAVTLGVSRNTVAGHVSRARGLGHLPPARPMITRDVAIIAAMLASGSSIDAVTRKLRIATPTLKLSMPGEFSSEAPK